MSVNEFFKPTLSKLIITIMLVLLFVPFINYDNGIRCFTVPCPSDTTGSLAKYVFLDNPYIYYISYTNLIIGIILSYLASCLIIYLYKKLKN